LGKGEGAENLAFSLVATITGVEAGNTYGPLDCRIGWIAAAMDRLLLLPGDKVLA
jgi:hypothetical protein